MVTEVMAWQQLPISCFSMACKWRQGQGWHVIRAGRKEEIPTPELRSNSTRDGERASRETGNDKAVCTPCMLMGTHASTGMTHDSKLTQRVWTTYTQGITASCIVAEAIGLKRGLIQEQVWDHRQQ